VPTSLPADLNAENILFINNAQVAYAYYKEYTLRWKEAQ
jgi:hypothetical protein